MSPEVLPIVVLLFLLGLALGSFGNVLILRVPQGEDIAGRSRCPHCKRVLAAWELIPVLSFFLLRGKCSTCRARIAWQYPIVEFISALLFLFAGTLSAFVFLPSLFLALAFWAMLLIAFIDARTQMIPDALTAALLVAAIIYHLLLHGFDPGGAMLAVAFFGLQWLLSRGRWVGSGDIFLGVALGVLVGSWMHLLIALMAAYIIGALYVSVFLGLGTMHRSEHVAFGPFLVIGGMISFLFADRLLAILLHT